VSQAILDARGGPVVPEVVDAPIGVTV